MFRVGDTFLVPSGGFSKTTLRAGQEINDIKQSSRYATSEVRLHKNVSGSSITSRKTLTAFGPKGIPLTNAFGSVVCQRPSPTTTQSSDKSSSRHLLREFALEPCHSHRII